MSHKPNGQRRIAAFCAACVASAVASAHHAEAADTVETWDSGAFDLELYSGAESSTGADSVAGTSSELVVGYGVTDTIATYVAVGMTTESDFGNRSTEVHVGGFGTPLNTDHIDFDLGLDVMRGHQGESYAVSPNVELNLDREPDLAAWGAYVRLAYVIESADMSTDDAAHAIELNPGLYLTAADGHQVFVEYATAMNPDPSPGEESLEAGAAIFGYNAVLTDAFELLIEAGVGLPQGDESASFGATAGVIATLP